MLDATITLNMHRGWAQRSRVEKAFAILAFSAVFLQKLGIGLFGNYMGLMRSSCSACCSGCSPTARR
jgi:hypothetical protein